SGRGCPSRHRFPIGSLPALPAHAPRAAGRSGATSCPCAKKSYRVVYERRSNPLGGRSNRLSSSFEAASERRRSDACRPLHYDKPSSFKMAHKSGGDDLGHDLVRVVDALAALISQCEGEGGGKVGRVGRREGFGRVEHAKG